MRLEMVKSRKLFSLVLCLSRAGEMNFYISLSFKDIGASEPNMYPASKIHSFKIWQVPTDKP